MHETAKHDPRGVSSAVALSSSSFMNQTVNNRDVMSQRLCTAAQIMQKQSVYVAWLENEIQEPKSDVISIQERIIELHEDSIWEKSNKL
jgi:hypothetical protein